MTATPPGKIAVGHVKDPIKTGWANIICDRRSDLGNPFEMGNDEKLRNPVCDAFDRWLHTNIKSRNFPDYIVPAHRIADLKISPKWKEPTVGAVMVELRRLSRLHQQGKNLMLRCHCKSTLRQDIRCHCDTLAQVIQQRSLLAPTITYADIGYTNLPPNQPVTGSDLLEFLDNDPENIQAFVDVAVVLAEGIFAVVIDGWMDLILQEIP